jgi:quercetin dioxygenase-like cupin family protein
MDPPHVHPQDAILIYLRNGYTWAAESLSGPELVRRGDVHVVPGKTFHLSGNAGSDPLEFLLIISS